MVGLILLLAPSSYVNVLTGQNGFLTGALLIGGLRLLDRHPIWAGVLFGSLTIKPHLGLLVPVVLIATGAWRAIFAAVATASVLILASIALFGIEPWHAFLNETTVVQVAILKYAFTSMTPSPFVTARLMGWSIATGYVLNAITAAIAVVTVIWTYRNASICPKLKIAIFATAMFLVSPYIFTYDITTLSAALAGLLAFETKERLKPGELLTIIAAWSLPVLVMASLPGTDLKLLIGPVALVALLAYLVARTGALASIFKANGRPDRPWYLKRGGAGRSL